MFTLRPSLPDPRRLARIASLGLAFGLAASPVVVLPGTASAAEVELAVTGLSVGSRGDAVVALQRALIARGVDVVGGADGAFGPMTLAALHAFQASVGLPQTSSVDDGTATALGLVESPLIGLARGNRGDTVAQLQRLLITLGQDPAGGADGVFGPGTEAALRNVQSAFGLSATGVVDADTAARLLTGNGTAAPAAPEAPAESPAPEAEPAAAPAASDSPLVGLKYGDWGRNVTTLQEQLIASGRELRGGADGLFGLVTMNAIKDFQTAKGLEVTGRVNEATAQALASTAADKSAAAASNPYSQLVGLRPGALGGAVEALQQRLLDLGVQVRGGVDGIFGPATANSLKAFQTQRGLNADGVVDAATAAALNAAPAAAAPTTDESPAVEVVADGRVGFAVYGEKGQRVTELQTALVAAGVTLRGGVDGDFGAATASAVMSFQRSAGLGVTGVVNQATADALGIGAQPIPVDSPVAVASIDVFPVQGRCGYADTWHAPRSGGRVHLGVDIIAARGNLVYAAVEGTITKVYYDRPGSLSGNGIRLTADDGTYFFYAHFDTIAEGISEGARVQAGQVVGTIGATGNTSTPHLHFEIHPNGGTAVNPYPVVKAVDACEITAPPAVG
jgi:peptidoglycan hydrolase-like protein with peptidoglycan-binding domain